MYGFRLTAIFMAALAVSFTGCGKSDGDGATAAGAPAPGGTLQVISPHPKIVIDEFGPAFTEWYKARTGRTVAVKWRDMGGTSDDLRWIKSEFEKRPAGVDMDVFFGGGSDPYVNLKEAGVLEPYKLPEGVLASIPKDINGVALVDADYAWYGAVLSGFGIMYNKSLLKTLHVEEPKTWEDLADPKLFTWVGGIDPRSSGSGHMMYEIMLQAYGWERGWRIMTAMAGNTRGFFKSASDIPDAVGKGQVAVGTAIDFYAQTQVALAGPERVGFVMPEGLTVINPDAIAILKGAPNMEAARAFVEFVMSEDGQKLWYLKAGQPGGPRKDTLYRMPVVPAVYEKYASGASVATNPFKWASGLTYDSAVGTARYEALNDLFGATLIDPHDDLVAAWKRIVSAGAAQAAIAELARPPVTEGELNQFRKTMSDPVARNSKLSDWTDFAREKYRRMAK